MEWVETTGRSVEEAKEAALDQLGVDEAEAEFEVLTDAKSGLFGRLRQEARVRARVRPTTPPPKVERRDRKRRGSSSGGSERPADAGSARPAKAPAKARAKAASGGDKAPAATARKKVTTAAAGEGDDMADQGVAGDGPSVDEQAAQAQAFVAGLVEAFDVEGRTELEQPDDETIEVRVVGDDLGLLIGPKGATLGAVQELTRTVVQRTIDVGRGARLNVDVGGYRQRRREALERFTRQVAETVQQSGSATAMEPMGAADRKIVHDTVNLLPGLRTTSEGEDPRRRVVIAPE